MASTARPLSQPPLPTGGFAKPPLQPIAFPIQRRSFLFWMTLAWSAFVASTLTLGTATLRYFFPNVLFEPPSQFEAGFPNTLHDGEVDEEFKSSQRVWLVRDGSEIYALLAICTHLGCTPNWFEDAQIFKCPCHGSGYYKSGINFEGPTPRPLERVAISLASDGQMLIDKSLTFRYEQGQWKDSRAFLKV